MSAAIPQEVNPVKKFSYCYVTVTQHILHRIHVSPYHHRPYENTSPTSYSRESLIHSVDTLVGVTVKHSGLLNIILVRILDAR